MSAPSPPPTPTTSDQSPTLLDDLSRLTELFGDVPVGELAIILDRHDNNVKAAAWAILNGERTPAAAAGLEETGDTSDASDQKGSADEEDNATNKQKGGNNAASAEIQRLYDSGTITKEEYDTMVEADRRAAAHRESRIMQQQNAEISNQKEPQESQAAAQLSSRLEFLATKLQTINLPRLIDQMEKDQEYADHLDFVNREMEEEAEHKRMVREAEAQSIEIMKEHLEEFLRTNPSATYESWIAALHPDNVVEGKLLEDVAGSMQIDHRFYVVDSDHRRLWNESLSERHDGDTRNYVPTRSVKHGSTAAGTSAAAAAPLDAGRKR